MPIIMDLSGPSETRAPSLFGMKTPQLYGLGYGGFTDSPVAQPLMIVVGLALGAYLAGARLRKR